MQKPWYETLTRRGWIVLWITVALVIGGFTYVTRDVCYVGDMPGNHLGYGSCMKMIDTVVNK
jgi:hypothetical protein